MTGSVLEQFDRRAAEQHLSGQWIVEAHLERAVGGPAPAGVVHVWSGADMAGALAEATVALGPVDTARRHLTMVNPGLGPGAGTTHTLAAGFQMVKSGEVCWAHRHSMSALRFVTRGHPAAYTAVDGERLHMQDFDLLLTPRFSWHDHHNPGDRDVVWLDGLDIGLVRALNQVFYEPYGQSSQQQRSGPADAVGTRAHWLRPAFERERTGRLPLRYPWSEVSERLALYGDHPGSPYDGLALRYANPVTGGPTLSTIDCWVQRLVPGFSGRPHRRSSSSVVHVVSGSGRLVTDAAEFALNVGDTAAIPNWLTHRLVNDSTVAPLLLFSMHDSPVLQAVGLFYEEPEDVLGATPPPANPTTPMTPLYRPGAFYEADER